MKQIEIFEDISDIEKKLNTDVSSGLSRRSARARAAEGGVRETSFFVRRRRKFLSCFFGVVKMLPAAILTLVAIAALFMGRSQLALAVLSTFISGSIISGMLYLSAQRHTERMEVYSNPTARVLRDGEEYVTDCRNVVVGDVLILRAGDYVPADACVVESKDATISAIGFDGGVGYTDMALDGFCGSERILAGSFVSSGVIKAVATAVGDDAYMSAYVREGGLQKKNSDPVVVKRTYRHLSKVVFVLSVLALVLAILGMFTTEYVGILEVFLMYLSLILSMTLISSPIAGRILLASMIRRAAHGGDGDYSIIKNNSAIDTLPNVTDAVICGLSGITDGERHVSSVYIAGEFLDNAADVAPDSHIFECIYSFVKARREGDVTPTEALELEGLMRYVRKVGFDTRAVDVKTTDLSFGASLCGAPAACAEVAGVSRKIYVGRDSSLLGKCDFYRAGDTLVPMGGLLEAAQSFIDTAGERGERAVIVVSECDEKTVLEGVLGLCEGTNSSISEIREALEVKGALISAVMLDDSEYTRFYLNAAGFSGDRIFTYNGSKPELHDCAVAYVGYSAWDYAELIESMRAAGRTVATIGVGDEYADAYDVADVTVSFDNVNYGSINYRESELKINVPDGIDESKRCSQHTRCYADVIIGRGNGVGGGLRGFFEAVRCAESFSFNYMQMMILFIAIEAVLVMMTFMSFISGIPMISYPTILLLVVALVFFSVAAFSTFKQRAFISKKKMSMSYFMRQIVRKLVPPTFASLVCFMFALYLDGAGYITDMAGIPLATTLGVIITFVLSFGGSMRACIGKKIDMTDIRGFAQKEKNSNKLINIAAMTLVLTSVVRMILTALILPGMAAEYGYVGICAETFILLGAYFVSFAMCALVIKLVRGIIKKHRIKKHK